MKRIIYLLLTALLVLTMALPAATASAAPVQKHAYDKYIQYRDPLTHTHRRLTEDQKLNVVYFGGSVTAGYGSTDGTRYSWQALSANWLANQFPDAKINVINTAIGESGTFLGTYRLHQDVIAKEPDLLFIEYAINDKYKGSTKEEAALQYETIVRELRTALPDCDIVTLLVIDEATSELLPELYPTAAGHEMIAKAYNISTVNVGASLVESLKDKAAEWSTYFIDIVHPTNAGYQKYYECLEEYLYNALVWQDFSGLTEGHTMPALQSKHLFDGNRMSLIGIKMRPYLVNTKGFLWSDSQFFGPASTPHMGYYYCPKGTQDAEITFRFFGTEFSIWSNFYDQSSIDIEIDGGSSKRIICAKHAPTVLVKELAPGNHYITIRPVTYGDGAESMNIGAVFFRDDTKQTGEAVDPATREESGNTSADKQNHTHVYEDWIYDSDVHWKECECGDVSDWAYHVYGGWVKVDGMNYTRTCKTCGYEQKGVAKDGGDPVPVEEEYWYDVPVYETVAVDTDRIETTDKNGGSKQNVTTVGKNRRRKTTTIAYTIWFYLLIILLILLVLAIITFFLIFFLKRKKKKDKEKQQS